MSKSSSPAAGPMSKGDMARFGLLAGGPPVSVDGLLVLVVVAILQIAKQIARAKKDFPNDAHQTN